jgi:hypothetical protein
MSAATRRQHAQAMHLAVYPCKIILVSPLPTGLSPPWAAARAKAWLYPSEEADTFEVCRRADRVPHALGTLGPGGNAPR